MICDQSTGQMYKHGSWSPPIEMAGGHSKKSLQAKQTAPNKASALGNLACYTLGNHHVEAQWETAFPPPIVKEMAVLCDTRSTFCQLYSLYWLRLELFLIWIFTAGLWSMGNSYLEPRLLSQDGKSLDFPHHSSFYYVVALPKWQNVSVYAVHCTGMIVNMQTHTSPCPPNTCTRFELEKHALPY